MAVSLHIFNTKFDIISSFEKNQLFILSNCTSNIWKPCTMSNTLQCWPSFLAVAAKKSANVLRIDLAIRVKEIFFFPNK